MLRKYGNMVGKNALKPSNQNTKIVIHVTFYSG